jgi:type I restriction enzyme S subunit
LDGTATSAVRLRRIRTGQFIYSRLFAFEGAYATVSNEYDGFFVSNEYPTFACIPEITRVEFLSCYFMSPTVWAVIANQSKGLGDRRQRVEPGRLLQHILWAPPLSWQNRVADVRRRISDLIHLQSASSMHLNAVEPAFLELCFGHTV